MIPSVLEVLYDLEPLQENLKLILEKGNLCLHNIAFQTWVGMPKSPRSKSAPRLPAPNLSSHQP